MRRLLPALIAAGAATLVALYTMLLPTRLAAEPAPALTPTRLPTSASFLPAVFKPLPPTATPSPTITPTPGPSPTATPTLPPPTYNNCQADPNPNAAPNYPIRIIAIDKENEIVRLRNESTSPVRMIGWRMCSITGNQHHPIDDTGPLVPGEIRSFTNGGGPIWNNAERDDGALYDAEGRLVSYFFD